jgi:glycosyltransferase involved in cell wall biosynthesis
LSHSNKSEIESKIVWHINHSDLDASDKVVNITADNLDKLGYESVIITPFSKVFDKTIKGRIIKKVIQCKIYLLKVLRILLTKDKFSFYNVIDSFSVFPTHFLLQKVKKPDIIIIYWISGLLTSKDIRNLSLKTGAKLIWYPTDMALMTGGCHYNWGCDNYKNDCRGCPAFKNNFTALLAKYNLNNRRKYLSDLNFSIISSSLEIDGQIKNSKVWQNHFVSKIYATVDETLYKPLDRQEAKKSFGVDLNKIILVAGAKSLDFERKGFKYLLESTTILIKKYPELYDSIELLLIGNDIESFIDLIPLKVINAGFLRSETRMVEFYNAADLLISPSIEECGPIMINQSLMCGTPALAFDVGIAPDFLINNETGYIVERMNAGAMADAIYSFVKEQIDVKERMRKNCRYMALSKFSSQTMGQGLAQLLKDIA